MNHNLIRTGDPDAFPHIKDPDGRVVLAYCRDCREGESGLADSCPGAWFTLQKEVSAWSLRNFGPQPAWQPMLGMVEELGEFFAARELASGHTSDSQVANFRLQMADAIADGAIYMVNLCTTAGLEFQNIYTHLPTAPQDLSDAQVTGVLAAACHAVLKEAQGIRGYDVKRRREELEVCIAMWYRWAGFQVWRFGMRTVVELTRDVWEVVRTRDWVKNPTDANEKVVAL